MQSHTQQSEHSTGIFRGKQASLSGRGRLSGFRPTYLGFILNIHAAQDAATQLLKSLQRGRMGVINSHNEWRNQKASVDPWHGCAGPTPDDSHRDPI